MHKEVDEEKGTKTRSREARKMRVTGKTGVNGELVHQAQPTSTYSHPVYTKKPVGPGPIDSPFSNPTLLDRAKRQRRRPVKLLNSDFVFDILQPVGGAMSGVTAMECSVDICLPFSVSPA